MRLNAVTSVHEYLSSIGPKYFSEDRGRWVFRGHTNKSWQLTPSGGRGGHTARDCRTHESSLFTIFKREAGSYLTPPPADDWEWLSVAQHHGLPTRFLDWTHNPLVGLYFAVVADPKIDGEVFALHSVKKVSERVRETSPFDITRPSKYYPNIVSPRIRAQEGLFIVCSDLERPLNEPLRDGWKLERLAIPGAQKASLRYELYRMGVHASALFPDIGGLTERLRWQHSVSALSASL